MELFDSHAHYNDDKFKNDIEEVIKSVYKSGVTKFVNAGYNIESSKKAIEIANKYEYVYATCGISPNDVEGFNETDIEEIKKLSQDKKVVAIGEIGLDYYWNKDNKEIQKNIFIKQIELANSLNLPIVIHTREAVSDTIDILKNTIDCKNKGIFHCCPLNVELVKEGLKLGFYISFSGSVTFKNSKNADEVIKLVPIERILIETDSPYLSPEPVRGTRNDSRNVKYVAEKIASVKGEQIEKIARITYENTKRIFKI